MRWFLTNDEAAALNRFLSYGDFLIAPPVLSADNLFLVIQINRGFSNSQDFFTLRVPVTTVTDQDVGAEPL